MKHLSVNDETGTVGGVSLDYNDNPLFHRIDAETLIIEKGVRVSRQGIAQFRSLRVIKNLKAIADIPPLTPTEERSLFLQYNFCRKKIAELHSIAGEDGPKPIRLAIQGWVKRALTIRETLAERNMPQVILLTAKYAKSGIEDSDRLSEAQDVLLKCIDKFDVDRGSDGDRSLAKQAGNKFSTYLWWGISKRFNKIIERRRDVASLDEKMEGNRYGDFADKRQDNSEVHAIGVISDIMDRNLAGLTEDETRIIKERFYSGGKVTLEKMSLIIGNNKNVVRQIEKRALDKLRTVVSELL